MSRTNASILLALVLAVIAYLLIALPPTVIAQYKAARELGPAWGYGYLASVAVGGLLLVFVAAWILARLWINARAKHRRRERRRRNPSQLSREERRQELQANLASGGEFAAGEEVPDDVRAEIRRSVAALEKKYQSRKLEIVAFGTVSSGKSSLLNALAGREIFRSDPRGGTTQARSDIPWPGDDRVVLVDTPGLAEVRGEERAHLAARAAKDADLVLFVADGSLKAYEVDLLRQLEAMEKRVLICLNKEDWFSAADREQLIGQIAEQVGSLVERADIVPVTARPAARSRVRVLPDGTEIEEAVPVEPDIGALAKRMMQVVRGGGEDLLVANLLLQSRGLVEESKRRVRASLDKRAEEIVGRYMWAAGGVAAVNPVPLLDLAGGSAILVKMTLDLGRVYRQQVDVDTVVNLLGQLTKNLVAMLGVTAATPAVASMIASLLKTVPGAGTIAGGMLQGLVQALVTRWVGKVFIVYFRDEMTTPPGGLAELARNKWQEVTQPAELIKLIQAGRQHLWNKEAAKDTNHTKEDGK
jgi:small GTP-binding protein